MTARVAGGNPSTTCRGPPRSAPGPRPVGGGCGHRWSWSARPGSASGSGRRGRGEEGRHRHRRSHQVDATGDQVGGIGGRSLDGDPTGITATVDGKQVDSTTVAADGVAHRRRRGARQLESLGNATVQLAKQALAPLMPGAGVDHQPGRWSPPAAAPWCEVGLTTSAAAGHRRRSTTSTPRASRPPGTAWSGRQPARRRPLRGPRQGTWCCSPPPPTASRAPRRPGPRRPAPGRRRVSTPSPCQRGTDVEALVGDGRHPGRHHRSRWPPRRQLDTGPSSRSPTSWRAASALTFPSPGRQPTTRR